MAGVTALVSTSNTANSTYYLSSTFTPAAGNLLIAFVGASGTVTTDAFLEITTEPWRRFTLITTAQWAASANYLYAYVANGPATGAACVARWDCTGDAATGSNINILGVSSMHRVGSNAIRQVAVQLNNGSSTRPNPVFGFSTSSINVIVGAVANDSSVAAMLPPTSWSEAFDSGYTTPLTGLETVYLNSGAISTTITWGSSSSSLNCAIVMELNTTTTDTWMGASLIAEMVRVY